MELKKRLPALPKEMFTGIGNVSVSRVELIADDEGKPSAAFGEVDFHTREIRVRKGIALSAAWVTLYHEMIHLYLHDAEVTLDEKTEEQVCTVIATALVADMAAQLKKKRSK